jgi:hypothetical protein
MEQRIKEAGLEEENNRRRREQERRAADRARENAERVEERKAAVSKKVEMVEKEKGLRIPEAAEKQGKVNELGFDDAAISSIEEVTGGKRT